MLIKELVNRNCKMRTGDALQLVGSDKLQCFVLDADGKPLAPTKEPKAWFLIRKKRAILVSKYPMVIQLSVSIGR